MNFSRISPSSALGAVLRWPLRLIPKRAVVPILQGRARGMRWVVGASDHGFWLGSFEYDKRGLFEDTVRPGQTVYDIGAHVGFYTLLASKLVGPSGHVVSFEPFSRNLEYLKRHVQLNGLSNVTVVASAVGDRSDMATFESGATESMGHLSATGLPVAVTLLDAFVAAGSAPPPDVIKMDIEGGEGDALRGAAAVVAAHHPIIFLATHSVALHRECVALLKGWGYSLEGASATADAGPGEILARYQSR